MSYFENHFGGGNHADLDRGHTPFLDDRQYLGAQRLSRFVRNAKNSFRILKCQRGDCGYRMAAEAVDCLHVRNQARAARWVKSGDGKDGGDAVSQAVVFHLQSATEDKSTSCEAAVIAVLNASFTA